MNQDRETVLITGASGGIGLELARIFAANAFDLVIVARRESELEALAERCRNDHGVRVDVLPMDLLLPDASATLAQRLEDANLAMLRSSWTWVSSRKSTRAITSGWCS